MIIFSTFYVSSEIPDDSEAKRLATLPKYDSREYGIITPVRDQGSTSLCWAYSAASASEASILRSGIDRTVNANTLALSPWQIGYARNQRGGDPLGNTKGEVTSSAGDWQNASGGTMYAASLLSQWCGPVMSNVAYNANGWENAAYKLKRAIAIDSQHVNSSASAREKMKRAIVKYGAVTFSYNNARETYYYNPNGEKNGVPHACTIVGWDDTIEAEKFTPGNTSQNGGWIVKNSYNSLPYFYLSYDVNCEQSYAFEYATADEYDYNYFYDAHAADSGMGSLYRITRAVNVFEAKNGSETEKECIRAVSVGTVGENAQCSVKIYADVNSTEPACEKTVNFEYGGYNLVELDEPVEVKKGSSFAVEVSVNNTYIRLSEDEGRSFAYRGGWISIPAPRIKAFTKMQSVRASSVKFSETGITARADKGKYMLILAGFEGGRLSSSEIFPLDFDSAKEVEIAVDFDKIKSYEAYLWSTDMRPMCEKAEYSDK